MAVAPEDEPKIINQLQREWEELRVGENAREMLVEKLFETVHRLSAENEDIRTENEKIKFHERHSFSEVRRLTQECKNLQDRLQQSPFVAVLVDGDNALFRDDLVQAGADGGQRAAKSLKDTVQAYVKDLLDSEAHWKILVRIYANLRGLASTYHKTGLVPNPRVVEEFLVGFNRELHLFEFVHVGEDKEAADNKIKANFDLLWTNEHCKHILLAASGDQGYVNFLRPYRGEDQSSAKLTLIESLPYPPSFKKLAVGFHNTSFEQVFRSSKIAAGQRQSYATATASSSATESQGSTVEDAPTRQIHLNRYGQRIDEKLQYWDDGIAKQLRRRSLCPRYFLTACDTPECPNSHDGDLTVEEKRALMRVARDEPCTEGTGCRNRNCLSGHHCVYDGRCNFGTFCKYGARMHGIEKEVMIVQ